MSEAATEMQRDIMVNGKDNSSLGVLQNSNQNAEMVRKRSRPFSWQRRRKRRLLNSQEAAADAPCKTFMNCKNKSLEKCGLKDSARSYNTKVINFTSLLALQFHLLFSYGDIYML